MNAFQIQTANGEIIRFLLYTDEAPATCQAFLNALPFARAFLHASVSGKEIWNDDAPGLDVPQENASIFARPGEIVIGPIRPERNKIAGFMGIFYGEGQLVDCGNIFGKVDPKDAALLKKLGDRIWRSGAEEIQFIAG